MKVDVATEYDLERLIWYAEEFHKESGTAISFDYGKVKETLRNAILKKDEFVVLVLRDNADFAIGILAAQIIVPHFSNDRVAMEWLWYVDPSYRSSKSIQLLKAYLYWAFDVMKCDHATMSTLDSELADKLHKLYTKIGFSKQENTYIIGRAT
jgi:hypothetical protein